LFQSQLPIMSAWYIRKFLKWYVKAYARSSSINEVSTNEMIRDKLPTILTTKRLMDKIDLHAMHMNAITSGVFRAVRLPIALNTDREVIDTALGKVPNPAYSRIARIKNTLELETFWASAALVSELKETDGVSVSETASDMEFDAEGQLLPLK
jgi:hypothetical protein